MDRQTQDALVKEKIQLNELVNGILDKADREHRTVSGTEQAMISAADVRISELRTKLGQNGAPEFGESRGRQTETVVTDARPDDDLALRAWALGPSRATAEMVAAAEHRGIRHQARELELRALSVGTTTAGGNSVGNEMIRAFHEAQKWYGRVEAGATVVNTETGATLPWPVVDDTSNTGRILTEGTGATTTTDPAFGVVNLESYKFSSDAVIVSVELLMDSAIPLAQYLGSALGTRIGRIKNTYMTTGSGTGQPKGIVVASTIGKTCSATNAFTFDEVIDLTHAVDPAYRSAKGAAFMMSDTVAGYARKIKDSNGLYIWQMSTQLGQPDRLFGYPVVINNDMSTAFTTGQKLILFGDLNRYVVRNAGNVSILRSDDLKFLEHSSVFLAFQRSDGNLPDTTAVKHLKLG